MKFWFHFISSGFRNKNVLKLPLRCKVNSIIALFVALPLLILSGFSLVKFKKLEAVYYRPIALRNYVYYLQKREIADLVRNPKLPLGIQSTDEDILGIIIVGESASRQFMGCYGYPRDTTPKMAARNWILYQDVMSSIPVTSRSVRYMFTDETVTGSHLTTSLPVVFSRLSNCSMDCISMQYKETFGSVDIIFGQCSRFMHLKPGLDGDYQLVEYLRAHRPDYDSIHGKKIVVFHLNGSHVPFKEQYPKEHSFFEEKQEQDCYDNSIRYTDYVINSLMDEIDNYHSPIWCLYVSDHGESPGKGIRQFKYYSTWEIPFAFWFNDAYRYSHAGLVASIEKHIDEPIQSDCVFEIVCSLMGVTWNGFHSERIPFNKEYVKHPRKLIKIR